MNCFIFYLSFISNLPMIFLCQNLNGKQCVVLNRDFQHNYKMLFIKFPYNNYIWRWNVNFKMVFGNQRIMSLVQNNSREESWWTKWNTSCRETIFKIEREHLLKYIPFTTTWPKPKVMVIFGVFFLVTCKNSFVFYLALYGVYFNSLHCLWGSFYKGF